MRRWTSKSRRSRCPDVTNLGADHDISSLADDGKPLWIEVKSIMDTDGRFEWPRAEGSDHHELWRVYEAHTEGPTVKVFRDPAA